ncbi:squalene/phytoene synthase family protein [Pacificoceanicola onchidii]|uniref:squalene/phytoene synthase family protein n=1 Tax=Pacificoceanicola onchidii TaxID=2562685 RepID=UPI001F1122F1|nr:squalene/phytoene synthase family protein [Pacificoceanicola onchidii]
MSDPFANNPDLIACAKLVEQGDPERFVATMAAPVQARTILFPLYAFNVEVSRAPWVTQEPMIAQMRLQWWWDALEEIRNGGIVRRHEVVTPLAMILDSTSAEQLQSLVDARRLDIERVPFTDEAALWDYLEKTGGSLMAAAARCFGETDTAAAQALGTATGLAGYLRAIPDLEARGRQPLPDGRPEAVAALAQQGLNRLAKTASRPKPAKPARLAAWQTAPLLRLAAKSPVRVKDGTLALSEFSKRARLLAATLR